MTNTALAIRADIHQLVAFRDGALSNFDQALALMGEASRQGALASPSRGSPKTLHYDSPSRKTFRQELDRNVWLHLMSVTQLDILMDKTARDAFRRTLDEDPPEVSVSTATATVEELFSNRRMTWRRGIATAFSKLDKRFKSHDGFKVGSKIVLTYAIRAYGGMTTEAEDTLIDVERIFRILDNKQPFENRQQGVMAVLLPMANKTGWDGHKSTPASGEVSSDYFRVKLFKNGNVHVHFLNEGLVERVNSLLSEYYGATLGDSHTTTHRNKDHQPKNMGAFMSPAPVVAQVIDRVMLSSGLRVLEPSCGSGNLGVAASDLGCVVTCYEADTGRANEARARGLEVSVLDFLEAHVSPVFDRVIMNPPFGRGVDCDHVRHAMKFLKPGGVLVAVMSSGAAYNEDRHSVAFREHVEAFSGSTGRHGDYYFSDLPPGSFAPETNVNTVIFKVCRPRA